jgi:hypothetical protein
MGTGFHLLLGVVGSLSLGALCAAVMVSSAIASLVGFFGMLAGAIGLNLPLVAVGALLWVLASAAAMLAYLATDRAWNSESVCRWRRARRVLR